MKNDEDLNKPVKKISFSDMMHAKPRTAPELEDAPEDAEPETLDMPDDAKDKGREDDSQDNPQTDAAVDDIAKKEGDEVLKAQDKDAEDVADTKTTFGGKVKRFLANWWHSPKKRWGTIAGLVVVLGVLGGIPSTRYTVAGMVMKADVTVTVVDSKSGTPVSGATVELGTQTAETDAKGVAKLKVPTGNRDLSVTKSYYKDHTSKHMVGFSGNNFKATLVATGRHVQVKVVNKLTNGILANATITVGSAKAVTDAKGLATVGLPSSATTKEASVSLDGYNTATVTVTAGADLGKNTFEIVPAGKLYFLSNQSGRVDVVKTDLDGSNRAVVLEGTGKEDKNNTSLLASRDWKYLALLARRTGDQPSVYLIDTTNGDLLTTIDEGNANFSLIGWNNARFVYSVNRNGYNSWQPHQQAIKSFDATTGRTLLLDQTNASGSSDNDFFKQLMGYTYLIGDQLVYNKSWSRSYYNPAPFGDKAATLETIGVDGSGHKVIQSFTATSSSETYLGISTTLYEPRELYVKYDSTYYKYEGGKLAEASDVTDDQFYNTTYPTYLLSPNGGNTFWAETRDGKDTLFTGNLDGGSAKQVASLNEYKPYGWFTDSYLLVSKSGSELYIVPATGGTPYKITDYYKPPYSYNGYGGGYGGL